jgi:hypothetical protein
VVIKIPTYMYYTVQKCTGLYITQVPEELEEVNRNPKRKDHFFNFMLLETVKSLFSSLSLLRFLDSATTEHSLLYYCSTS